MSEFFFSPIRASRASLRTVLDMTEALRNPVQLVLESIALEGLDGIALDDLALRLTHLTKAKVENHAYLFRVAVRQEQEDVEIFLLNEKRPSLINKNDYKFHLVEDNVRNVKGSCDSYETRVNITTEARKIGEFDEVVQTFANGEPRRIVLVASQFMRERALVKPLTCNEVLADLSGMLYALLERIGRAREEGEISSDSLQQLGVDSKTLFYYRKILLKKRLITKQDYCYRDDEGKNMQGCVLHLSRFSVEWKSQSEQAVSNLLNLASVKAERGQRGILTVEDIRKETGISPEKCKKLLKHPTLQSHFTETRVPYSVAYDKPFEEEALSKRSRKKGRNNEPEIRVIELRKRKKTAKSNMETNENEDNNNNEEDLEDCTKMFVEAQKHHPLKSFLRQGYEALLEAGQSGMTQIELGIKLGLSRLESRQLARNLIRRSLVVVHMRDIGRQREAVFVANHKNCLQNNGSGNGIAAEIERAKDQFQFMAEGLQDKTDYNMDSTLNDTTNMALDDTNMLADLSSADNSTFNDITSATANDSELLGITVSKEIFGADRTKNSELSEQLVGDIQVLHNTLNSENISPRKRKRLDKSDYRDHTHSNGNNEGLSLKQLNRVNLILESVKTNRVVNAFKLQKAIERNEADQGYSEKMDKKSLLRQLYRLEASKHLKNICIKLKLDSKEKQLHFICDRTVDKNDSMITSAVEEAKMKFSLEQEPKTSQANNPKEEEDTAESWKNSAKELKTLLNDADNTATKSDGSGKFVKGQGRIYGLQPKFIRMQDLHILLIHLTRHVIQKIEEGEKQEVVTRLLNQTGCDNKEELEKLKMEMSLMDIYHCNDTNERVQNSSQNVDWRMFIPPLAQHEGWPSGWCLLSDILLRLPLSLFVRLVNVTFEVEGLDSYLSHPIRKHYLIKTLPLSIRRMLLRQRKYVFKVHEIITQLAFVGLVQISGMMSKEKEKMFVYVNEQASLLNTATATPNNIVTLVEERESFQRLQYQLKSRSSAELFWVALRDICVLTPLSNSVSNSDENSANMSIRCEKKPELLEALKAVKAEEAALNDNGKVPGDGAGAAGLDSALFAHVKRSWSWLPPSAPGEITKTFKMGKRVLRAKVDVGGPHSTSIKRRRKSSNNKTTAPDSVSSTSDKTSKSRGPKKPFYDAKDKAALQLMTKLRVDWSDREDSFLLLCKVAALYLARRCYRNETTRYHMPPHVSVRDLLHNRFEESSNKTSRACQRRINYMMRNKVTEQNVKLVLADVVRDLEMEHLCVKIEREHQENLATATKDEHLKLLFEPVVFKLLEKYDDQGQERTNMIDRLDQCKITIPDTLEEFKEQFDVATAAETWAGGQGNTELSIRDIEASVVESLIMSSLCTATDKTNRSFVLYKIYQQYEDSLLRSVMENLRSSRMVSLKKSYDTKRMARSKDISALSASPYQLSVTFAHTLLGRYQYDLFTETWKSFKSFLCYSIVEERPSDVISEAKGGSVAALVALMASDKVLFSTKVPEQLVVLDPNLASMMDNKGDSQHLEKIVKRYKSLLRLSGNFEVRDLLELAKDQNEQSSPSTKEIGQGEGSSSQAEPKIKRCRTTKESMLPPIADFEEDEMILEKSMTISSTSSTSSSSLQPVRSRVALHLMREELKPSSSSTTKTTTNLGSRIQHAYDFFVIASCKVDVKLAEANRAKQNENQEMVTVGNETSVRFKAPDSMLAFSMHTMRDVMAKFGLDPTGLANNAVENLRETVLPGRTVIDESHNDKVIKEKVMESIYEAIKTRKEQGMPCRDVKGLVNEKLTRSELEKKLEELLKKNRVIRAGIDEPRFVSREHSKPWLLHSFRATRTKTREKIDPSLPPSESNMPKLEELDVKLRPWIRMDGTLNRRVLDRLLGAILSFVMEKPGQTLEKVGKRFKPALQAMHSRELVELLLRIGAVSFLKVQEEPNENEGSLLFEVFKPRPKVNIKCISESFLLEENEDVLVEAGPDAVLRLAQFIGDKRYNLDFSCQCTCHPERL